MCLQFSFLARLLSLPVNFLFSIELWITLYPSDTQLFVWNQHSTQPVLKYCEHTAAVKAIAWSPHLHGLLASGGGTADRCIRFWNTTTNSHLSCMDTGSQVAHLLYYTSALLNWFEHAWNRKSLFNRILRENCEASYKLMLEENPSLAAFWNTFYYMSRVSLILLRSHDNPISATAINNLFQEIPKWSLWLVEIFLPLVGGLFK